MATIPQNAMSSASGNVERRDERRARVAEEEEENAVTRPMPTSRFSITVCVVTFTSVAAVVVGLDVHPRRQEVVLADVVDALVDALERRLRLAAVAHEDDALHDVGVVVVADDAEPRRGADVRRRRRPARGRGCPSASMITMSSMSRCDVVREPKRPMPRTL